MIGDSKGDIEAGRNFGLRTILVRTGHGKELEKKECNCWNYIQNDLLDGVKRILQVD